ncbi:MAG: hypothetical protein D3914_01465 [Candidatus Electrothrix sp. LOE2]|nr:hypothetical protein [Candidatus Electrothrix sp. LOE2]
MCSPFYAGQTRRFALLCRADTQVCPYNSAPENGDFISCRFSNICPAGQNFDIFIDVLKNTNEGLFFL